MEKLSKQVAEKAKISEKQAQIAVDEVMNFVKTRLRDSLEVKINEAITGEPDPTMLEKLGELTDDAQERINELANKTQDFLKEKFASNEKGTEREMQILTETQQKVEEFANIAKDKIYAFKERAEKMVREKANYVKTDTEGKKEKANYIDEANEKIEELSDDVRDKLTDLAGSASSFFKNTFSKKDEKKEPPKEKNKDKEKE